MLLQRVIVAAILLPVGIAVIFLGGVWFAAAIALILGLAGWEWAQLFRHGGLQPAGVLVVTGVLFILAGRIYGDPLIEGGLVALAVLASMTYHLVAYERGRDQAGTDFAITVAGFLYFGWLGAYFVNLRELPNGQWWILLVLPAIWLADSGAYFIGRQFGRRKLSPRLSPKKTWEGYLGGVLVGVLGTALLAYLWGLIIGPSWGIGPLGGALLGGVLAVITPLGDLGESMVKRQVGMKDSGKLLPGHGGAWDRIDSWLWGAAIGYFLIVFVL